MNNIINKKQVKYINTNKLQIIIRYIDNEIIYIDYNSEEDTEKAFGNLTDGLTYGSSGDLVIF